MALERDLLGDELSRYDVTADEVTVNGVVYRQCLESSDTYLTSAGPVSVTRHLYRPAGRGSKSICPLELRAGIIDGWWTPQAARQGAFVMAHLTPREGQELFGELGGMQPSRSTLDRLPKTLSTHWEAHRADFEATLRASETVPVAASVLAVSLDGVMAPMATEVADEASPQAPAVSAPADSEVRDPQVAKSETTEPVASASSGKRHDREASCGTVTLKATLCDPLTAECQSILAVRPELTVVK